MSQLEELIAELCPDGVKFKKLKEVASVSIGEFVHKNKQNPNGPYPVYNGGTSNTGFYDDYNRTANKIIISARGANAGFINRVFVDFWSGNSCYTISTEKYIDWNFAYYVLKNSENQLINIQQKGGIPAISKKQVEEFKFPVPPLPVQQEIVSILDNFTELTAELTVELTARKKQYEYYLDEFYGHDYEGMLKMADNQSVKILPLSEIGTLTRGKRFVKADSEGLTSGVPCLHYGELYTYYGVSAEKSKSFVKPELATKLRFATKGDVVIVGAGENNIDIGVGVAWLGDEDIAVHDACYTLTHNQNPKYISYYLRTNIYHNQIKKYVSEGKICSISASGLGKALIPVPSIEEQNRIVSILERFDNLCNDKSKGLPAEIEARHKQYEYYRDKLLTFKEFS